MSLVLLEPPRTGNPHHFEDVVNAPLSACLFTGYIASVLHQHNINATITDAHLSGWSKEQTIAHLSAKTLRLLCVHTVFQWERTRDIFDLLSTLKSENPTLHINLYGYYPTFSYKKILADYPFVDSITVGEPEFTTLCLAETIRANDNFTPLDGSKQGEEKEKEKEKEKGLSRGIDIPGLAVRNESGDIVYHPRPPIQDLDQLPFPNREDINIYREKGIVTYIQGSRGCYGHCTFCYLNPFYGQRDQWRGRSAKNIFEEIRTLYTEHAITNFYFSDANFFGPGKNGKERAVTLAELILASNLDIHFGFECRANDVEEHSLSRLVMAGLTNVFLGLESGDPTSLKRFRKRTTIEENKRAIQLLRDYGIEPTFGFIMFEPNSTLESVRNNFTFLREMGIMTTPSVTAHLLHHRQTLFEGTPDYQAVMDEAACSHDSFTGYEALYTIKDPKVEVFSQIISNVCRAALSLIPNTFDCKPGTPGNNVDSAPLRVVNDTLIALFEKVLAGFETDSTSCSPDAVEKTSRELTHEVAAVFQ